MKESDDNLFTITQHEVSSGSVKAVLAIKNDHSILKGHFPGQPVVPGVCMMEVIQKLLELKAQRKLMMHHADNIKFLSVIDTNQISVVEATVSVQNQDNSYIVNATLFSGSVTFFKLKASFRPLE